MPFLAHFLCYLRCMKHLYLVFILLALSASVNAQPPAQKDMPQRTPEEMARKQTYMLIRELGLTDSIVIDSIYRINVRHNKRRMQRQSRAEELQGMYLFLEEIKGVVTPEQYDQFMNRKPDCPRHPHATYAPARPDSVARRPVAQ